eukprot:11171014-Lingulodinium_polyedra.AAC.1
MEDKVGEIDSEEDVFEKKAKQRKQGLSFESARSELVCARKAFAEVTSPPPPCKTRSTMPSFCIISA